MSSLGETVNGSYFDRWCRRSIIVARIQFFLALPYALILLTENSTSTATGNDARAIPDWKKGLAVVPICLAFINSELYHHLRWLWEVCTSQGTARSGD